MERKIYTIDVSKMSIREAENTIKTFKLIVKYKLSCPKLMESFIKE